MSTSNQEQFNKVIEHFEKELANLRIGRAMPNIVENILVDAYGTKTPLMQLAAISVPEPQTLFIQPWDVSTAKEIEKSIQKANLGLNPIVDGKIIRINFPPLTEEKRKELVKILNQKTEEAKIGIKGVREDKLKEIKKSEKDKEISEDERIRLEKDLQKQVEEMQNRIKQIGEKKEKDLLTL